MKMIYSCREMADWVSKELDQRLPLSVRIRMKIHLYMCRNCHTYREQIHHVERCLERYYSEDAPAETSLSEEKKRALKEILKRGTSK